MIFAENISSRTARIKPIFRTTYLSGSVTHEATTFPCKIQQCPGQSCIIKAPPLDKLTLIEIKPVVVGALSDQIMRSARTSTSLPACFFRFTSSECGSCRHHSPLHGQRDIVRLLPLTKKRSTGVRNAIPTLFECRCLP